RNGDANPGRVPAKEFGPIKRFYPPHQKQGRTGAVGRLLITLNQCSSTRFLLPLCQLIISPCVCGLSWCCQVCQSLAMEEACSVRPRVLVITAVTFTSHPQPLKLLI